MPYAPHPPELREACVRAVLGEGKSAKGVARERGLPASTVNTWVRIARRRREAAREAARTSKLADMSWPDLLDRIARKCAEQLLDAETITADEKRAADIMASCLDQHRLMQTTDTTDRGYAMTWLEEEAAR